MNKNISLGNLIDTKSLVKLMRKAEPLIVGIDGPMVYICNSHWIVRIRQDAQVMAEAFKILGKLPEDGKALSRYRNQNECGDFSLDNLKKFFADPFYATCHDTRMSQDIGGHDLRIFDCEGQGERCYIAIDRIYFDMIHTYARAASQKCHKNSAILFTGNYDECALILPVHHDDLPYMR